MNAKVKEVETIKAEVKALAEQVDQLKLELESTLKLMPKKQTPTQEVTTAP